MDSEPLCYNRRGVMARWQIGLIVLLLLLAFFATPIVGFFYPGRLFMAGSGLALAVIAGLSALANWKRPNGMV